MKKISLVLILSLTSIYAQEVKTTKKIKYEYKKHEKFDFESIGVEGDIDSTGEISIDPRVKQKFKNRLPERENFDEELIEGVDGIR
jgi:hypothetical protein